MKKWQFLLVVLVALSGLSHAAMVGFSPVEGYTTDNLQGQPGSGSVWNCTENNSLYIFRVKTETTNAHTDYLNIALSYVHGTGDDNIIDYATKRMEPVTGSFSAGYCFYYTAYAHNIGDETCIALGQSNDSNWGVYLGANKTSAGSLAYHDGNGWNEIVTGLRTQKWYSVIINGNTDTGLFDLTIYQEDLMDNQNATAGLLAEAIGLSFRDNPDTLAYVMLTNLGSTQDTGGYNHLYDDLYLIPEPATLTIFGVGALLILRRRSS